MSAFIVEDKTINRTWGPTQGKSMSHKSHNFQLKRGYQANYACKYCGVEMIGDSRADQPCKNADLYVIDQELNELPWEPPLKREESQ